MYLITDWTRVGNLVHADRQNDFLKSLAMRLFLPPRRLQFASVTFLFGLQLALLSADEFARWLGWI